MKDLLDRSAAAAARTRSLVAEAGMLVAALKQTFHASASLMRRPPRLLHGASDAAGSRVLVGRLQSTDDGVLVLEPGTRIVLGPGVAMPNVASGTSLIVVLVLQDGVLVATSVRLARSARP